MINISIAQALDVYTQLILAMDGKASHGYEAEIYAYKLLPNIPSETFGTKAEFRNAYYKAALALCELCYYMREEWNVEILINEIQIEVWRSKCAMNQFVFDHRVKVYVINKRQ
jgi:hypothetical protein